MKKFLKVLLPKNIYNRIEDESKSWFITCDKCGYSISYYDAGGLRAFATSKKFVFGKCPNCKKYKFLKVTKKR